jgi:hypothetical protein
MRPIQTNKADPCSHTPGTIMQEQAKQMALLVDQLAQSKHQPWFTLSASSSSGFHSSALGGSAGETMTSGHEKTRDSHVRWPDFCSVSLTLAMMRVGCLRSGSASGKTEGLVQAFRFRPARQACRRLARDAADSSPWLMQAVVWRWQQWASEFAREVLDGELFFCGVACTCL